MAISAVPIRNQDGATAIANWYNQTAAPEFDVFRSNVPTDDISNQVLWANFTPSTAIANDGSNSALWQACSLSCQGKQFNLQLLLPPGSMFNAGLINKRAGLNDATTNLPKADGAGGKNSGGWANILPILIRPATYAEALYAVATTGIGTGVGALGANGNPGLLIFDSTQGVLTFQDIFNAWGS